ncbi:hypothetical protein ABBQ32_004845 [Trebouxia sp. C0010 RCD-2024]
MGDDTHLVISQICSNVEPPPVLAASRADDQVGVITHVGGLHHLISRCAGAIALGLVVAVAQQPEGIRVQFAQHVDQLYAALERKQQLLQYHSK